MDRKACWRSGSSPWALTWRRPDRSDRSDRSAAVVLRRPIWACDRSDVKSQENAAVIAEGLAAYATTYCEMSDADDVVRTKLLTHWERLGSPTGAFRAAATAVTEQPQPVVESAETTERSRMIREHLGVTSAETQLAAALRARELLQDLAEEHG